MEKGFITKEAKLYLPAESWEEIAISDAEIIYKPRYFHKTFEWRDVQKLRSEKLPFIYIKYAESKIVYVEACSGVVREAPVFYAIKDKSLIISDSPQRITKHFGFHDLNESALNEFLSFGYATTHKTLLNEVYSIQAGEALVFDNYKIKIETRYLYNTSSINRQPREELFQKLKKVTEEVFHKLIVSLKGKTAIVPLSGGYDSRFIVAMLKLGGYDNVACYAWGVKGDREIEVSKAVAKKLGYKWKAIDYSRQNWMNAITSEWYRDCMRFVSRDTSISGSASLPFLNYLKLIQIQKDSVLIPGHTADFLGGGHIPATLHTNSTAEDVVESIFGKHYLGTTKSYNELLAKEIRRQVNLYGSQSTELYRAFEIWNWRERQSKFIANINRYYEYFGYSWNMPFWSAEFVNFWSAVPLEEKRDLNLYDEFLENEIFEKLDLQFPIDRKRAGKHGKFLPGQNPLHFLKKYKIYRNISAKLRSKVASNPFGFEYILPDLYNLSRQDFPQGFALMEGYKKKFNIKHSSNPYAYISQYVLALALEDLENDLLG
ncbi:MAG: asparagine synthase C-terminal domain-containing protein [Balneolales bacterium]